MDIETFEKQWAEVLKAREQLKQRLREAVRVEGIRLELAICEAIRSYPAAAGRQDWTYGLDNLDFAEFVPDFAGHLIDSIKKAAISGGYKDA